MSLTASPVRLVALVLAFLAVFSVAAPAAGAQSARTACSATVMVDGVEYTLDISLSASAASRVTGPIQVSVSSSGRATLGTSDQGLNNRGYRVSNTRSRDTGVVTFRVTVPSRSSASVEVGVASVSAGALSVPGTTNTAAVIVTYR